MKHAAIKSMIKTQYNLTDDDTIDVEFILSDNDMYEFIVTDYNNHNDSIRTTSIKIESVYDIKIVE